MDQRRGYSQKSRNPTREETVKMETTKKMYTTPTLVVHGDVATITQATTSGNKLDKNLPAGSSLTMVMQSLTS